VLLRDGPSGPEVLLTLRSRLLRFMGGAAVFPGGAVGSEDLDPRWESAANLAPAEAARRLDETDGTISLGLHICALREAFEEVGFLSGIGPVDRLKREHAHRAWLDQILEAGVVLDAASLVPAGRWVTPVSSPVRFDTHFFVTRADDKWAPVPDPREVDDARWTTPSDALEALAAGELVMAPPTIHVLQSITGCDDVTTAIVRLSGNLDAGVMPMSVAVHPLVRLVVAPNPGLMTGPGTNSYAVGTHDGCVVDPAVDDEAYLNALLENLPTVKTVVVSHRHPDHMGGVRRIVEQTGASVRAWGGSEIDGMPVIPLMDGEVIACGDAQLRVVYTPGHSSDHVCLLLDDVLFSGDAILGEGTAVIAPPDGNLDDYLASLRRLRSLPLNRILPGHFRSIDNAHGVIDDYLAHREERHRAILDVLQAADSTVEQIVETVYADTPSDLHSLAALTVLAHLEMAERHGRARRTGKKWRSAGKMQEQDL
jgi:glyoxylase-like metal-dependent hydrolase (beta-lactamase superfamily II)/8-oxo-dGTP pyrophosphatase MutT (NUDIX family)